MAALLDLGRVALDVVLAVGPMVSSEHVAQTQHTVQMRPTIGAIRDICNGI